jgi:hypothetical protein
MTKSRQIGELLLRLEGCTIADILAATGWPSVSVAWHARNNGLRLNVVKNKGQPKRYFGRKPAIKIRERVDHPSAPASPSIITNGRMPAIDLRPSEAPITSRVLKTETAETKHIVRWRRASAEQASLPLPVPKQKRRASPPTSMTVSDFCSAIDGDMFELISEGGRVSMARCKSCHLIYRLPQRRISASYAEHIRRHAETHRRRRERIRGRTA